jgi:hypothetical protein
MRRDKAVVAWCCFGRVRRAFYRRLFTLVSPAMIDFLHLLWCIGVAREPTELSRGGETTMTSNMKCLLPVLAAFTFATVLPAPAKFIPDPIVQYKMDARLDVQAKTVKGHLVLTWKNHTADTIPDLQFHLYLNAFKNNQSTFMREGGAESRRVRHRDSADAWGYEQVQSLKVDGADLTSAIHFIAPDDGNPNDQTVARVVLPHAIPPHGTATIEIDWTSKLPHVFARTGFHNNFFLVAQWFPKIGVYEGPGDRHRKQGGWNCHQFHMDTEFYADYGSWDVNLTVPTTFEIAATGAQQSHKDNGDGTTTYNYKQEDVHDFAWTTQPKSEVEKIERWFRADQQVSAADYFFWMTKLHPECLTGTRTYANGRMVSNDMPEKCRPYLDEVKLQDVKVTLFIQKEHRDQIDRHFNAVFAGLKWYGLMFGKYPYDVATVVDPPFGGGGAGGMEYPTFFTAGTTYWPAKYGSTPEGVTIHEFGHQFWYGLVGNNEFEEAWLDEGFNSYSTTKTEIYGYGHFQDYERVFGIPIPAQAWTQIPIPRYPWMGVGDVGIGQYWEWVPEDPFLSRAGFYSGEARTDTMERYAWLDLSRNSYGDQAYAKPELTLHTLEALLGEKWWPAIRTYQLRYRWKHPDALDFIHTVEEVTGQKLHCFDDANFKPGDPHLFNTAVSPMSGTCSCGASQSGGGADTNCALQHFFDQTMYGTDTVNYAVTVSSEHEPAWHGYRNQGGKPELAPKEKDKHQPYESEILVRRLGEMIFPVTVRVQFADGTSKQEQWDGQYRWTKFYYPGKKVVAATVDPAWKWKLEVSRVDNAWVAQPNSLAADKWYLRWVVWIENVMNAFAYFS